MSTVESIAIIAGDDNTDEVWISVLRTINGAVTRTIERFRTRLFDNTTLSDAWFVDAGGSGIRTYQPAEGTAGVAGEYPTLRATTAQADPGLTQTTAIANVTDLQNMNNDKAGNYYLTGDIDASATSGWNGGAGFLPIGNAVTPFTGSFDGAGYTITGLTINRPTTSYIGLFGNARNTAQIANVTLASASVVGRSFVGVLAGAVDNGGGNNPLVQNCHTGGTMTFPADATTRANIGGLVGFVQGKKSTSADVYIYDCSSSVAIDGTSITGTLSVVGGCIGQSEQAVISNCFATGQVNLGTDPQTLSAGGFIGELDELTSISYCYATGDVSAYDQVGGFMGASGGASDSSIIQNCYATGNVTAEVDNAGGFAGVNSVDITDCYAWGDVTVTAATGDVGGFVGIDFVPSSPDYNQAYSIGAVSGGDNQGGFIATSQAGTFSDCYWDTETSGQATSDEGTGQTTAWLKDKTGFPVTWDYDTIWYNPYVADTTVAESYGDYPTGYAHLEGETVNILADGIKYPPQTVTNGDIDDSAFSDATNIIVGLPVRYKLVPMELNFGDLGFCLNKRIVTILLDLFQSLDGKYGCDLTQTTGLDQIVYYRPNYDAGPTLFTGVKRLPVSHGYNREGNIILWGDHNLPHTVLGIGAKVGVE